MQDDFGDRMKFLESFETERRLLPTLPVYARIDGHGFSKFTKGMRRPYDERFHSLMVEATKHVVETTHAKIGYCQSDEISIVWHAPDYRSELFFDGKIQKINSIVATKITAAFTHALWTHEDHEFRAFAHRMPHFDCRVFSMPSQVETANMVLWRNQDATKNAVSMAAHHYFSHNSLHGMSGAQMQERLFQEKGINFNDYPEFFKRGTFVRKVTTQRSLTEEELSRIPENKRPAPGTLFTRNKVQAISMPIFSKVTNRIGVIFDNEEPMEDIKCHTV